MVGNVFDSIYEEYSDLDFFINKAYWHSKRDSDTPSSLRFKILNDLSKILRNDNLDYFFDDLTCKDLFQNKKLKNNVHIDSIILNKIQYKNIHQKVKDYFLQDWVLVKSSKNQYIFNKENRLIRISFARIPFIMNFQNKNYDLENKNNSFNLGKLSKIYFYRNIISSQRYISERLSGMFNFKIREKNINYKHLSFEEFLKINIEAKDSINWLLRKPHLDLVSNNKKNITCESIINYFLENKNYDSVKQKIVECNTTNKFEEPININKKFWNNGNNFYIYPIIYGFKKNVVPYKNANEYISSNSNIPLYSQEYFESLKDMNDEEIRKLFENSPLEVTNNSITSGRHRVFAMIGRILRQEQYIPIYAREITFS